MDLPIEPRLGKTVLAAVVLKCLDPVLTIACALSYKDPFVIPTNDADKRELKKLKREMSLDVQSDHVLLANACKTAWSEKDFRKSKIANYISFATMSYIRGLQKVFELFFVNLYKKVIFPAYVFFWGIASFFMLNFLKTLYFFEILNFLKCLCFFKILNSFHHF